MLLHGASYPADLGYRDELMQMVERNRLKYWGTVSRPKEAPDWKGDTGRVEAFFDGARLDELEKRCGLPAGGFTPKNVVIYICGLTGTITGTMIPLIDRGFVPDFKRIREALGVPADAKDSVFYEQYDTEPVINIKDPAVVEPLQGAHASRAREAVTAFVFGATGFVGREVVRQLARARDARRSRTSVPIRAARRVARQARRARREGRHDAVGRRRARGALDASRADAALHLDRHDARPREGRPRRRRHLREGRLRPDEDRGRCGARIEGEAAPRLPVRPRRRCERARRVHEGARQGRGRRARRRRCRG